ncbi:MAG: Asp-tRNA(Asn)/Glu-tRNA(Gln) amidotransferase subunit GatC [Polyangiales bacterium]
MLQNLPRDDLVTIDVGAVVARTASLRYSAAMVLTPASTAPSTATPAITPAQVAHIGRLARLTLRDDEVPVIAAQLEKILGHIAELSKVDTTGVPPTSQVGVDRLPLRADEVKPGVSREAALGAAPETAGGGFVVPAFVDE